MPSRRYLSASAGAGAIALALAAAGPHPAAATVILRPDSNPPVLAGDVFHYKSTTTTTTTDQGKSRSPRR